jgi:hypothetical protein
MTVTPTNLRTHADLIAKSDTATALRWAATEIERQAAEILELQCALKPFAEVVSWVEECQSKDRDAKFPIFGLTLHMNTGASSFGYSFGQKQFEAAHRALKRSKPTFETRVAVLQTALRKAHNWMVAFADEPMSLSEHKELDRDRDEVCKVLNDA